MFRSILIGAAAAGLLIAGALTSLASNSHASGGSVSALAKAAEHAATVTNSTPTTPHASPQAQAQSDVDTETDTETETDANDTEAADQAATTATIEQDKAQEHQGGGESDSGGND